MLAQHTNPSQFIHVWYVIITRKTPFQDGNDDIYLIQVFPGFQLLDLVWGCCMEFCIAHYTLYNYS